MKNVFLINIAMNWFTTCIIIVIIITVVLLILDLGTRWGWVVNVTPRPRFSPGEKNPGTHWTGGWVGPRNYLDTGATEKNPFASTGDRTSIAQS
jgi:hypothetical protein